MVLYSTSQFFPLPCLVPTDHVSHDTSTQKILRNARLVEHGTLKADPMKESISLQLDMVNILWVSHDSLHSYVLTLFVASVLFKFFPCRGKSSNFLKFNVVAAPHSRSVITFYIRPCVYYM